MAEFRLATLADGPELVDLSLRAYAPIRELGIHFAAATADLALVEKNLTNNMCFVMEEEGRIVSTISVRMPWGPQAGPYGLPHLWWFASDPDAGRKGIGREMITWCEETMLRDTLKAPAVSLGTADKHPWLIEMYERRGYEVQGSKDLGRGHLTIFMKKILIPEFRA
ncbi:GNAT family N-acetyltransferase [Paenibacillus daejeonensis]|uniref:GNAT family N-acetyltransferase n=1 Tax=Paenibacillus daejeonensis TaxID=135193 RepID=UPI0003747258|nr:GNAT family N-acetyltransferase [Paenibacillus daejeonensis]